MSSYNKIIFLSIFFIFVNISNGKNIQNTHSKYKEDLLTSLAIDSEYNERFNESLVVYEKLFKNKPSYEYFIKMIYLSNRLKKYKKIQKLITKNLKRYKNKEELLLQEYVLTSLKLKQYKKALKKAKKLLKKYNNSKNYTLVADVYYINKKYKKALKYYESSYGKKKNLDSLLKLVDILYNYLNKKKTAISYLETYHRLNGCNKEVCIRLLQYYKQKGNLDGMLSISNVMFRKYKDIYPKVKLIKLKNLIVDLYIKQDINKAIKFLEKTKFDDRKLLNLYALQKNYKKALKLVRKIYLQTGNKSFLGQIAILEYEINFKKYRQNIIYNFEKSLKYKSNDEYENYYGYILVEHNIDIKKGIKLIKKALKKYPKNIAYRDSLAWGYYKNKQCKKAFKIMYSIVEEIGLGDNEIKKHWYKIKKCKGKR